MENKKGHTSRQAGFTLLEILLVVAAIAILAGIVIVAINPTKQLGDTRNAQRHSDANTIINAIYQYTIDEGSLPSGIDAVAGTSQVLGTAASGCDSTCGADTTVAACLDLSSDLAPDYIVDIPMDPSEGVATNTDYYVNAAGNGRLTVGVCDPEQGAVIEITR